MARSNGYILGFATAVCVVCSVFVSGAALSLKDQQVKNAELDLRKNVVSVSGLTDSGQAVTEEDVKKFYYDAEADTEKAANRVEPGYIELTTGAVTDTATAKAAIKADKASCKARTKKELTDNPAKIACLPKYKAVYTVYKDNAVSRIILDVEGKGLWSTMKGFLAMGTDGKTIQGLTFYSHAETPGLGGEIDNPVWKKIWVGEQAFKNGKPDITIVKGTAPQGPTAQQDGKIDGLSGATLTSNGVQYLVNFWLGPKGYGPYLNTVTKGS